MTKQLVFACDESMGCTGTVIGTVVDRVGSTVVIAGDGVDAGLFFARGPAGTRRLATQQDAVDLATYWAMDAADHSGYRNGTVVTVVSGSNRGKSGIVVGYEEGAYKVKFKDGKIETIGDPQLVRGGATDADFSDEDVKAFKDFERPATRDFPREPGTHTGRLGSGGSKSLNTTREFPREPGTHTGRLGRTRDAQAPTPEGKWSEVYDRNGKKVRVWIPSKETASKEGGGAKDIHMQDVVAKQLREMAKRATDPAEAAKLEARAKEMEGSADADPEEIRKAWRGAEPAAQKPRPAAKKEQYRSGWSKQDLQGYGFESIDDEAEK